MLKLHKNSLGVHAQLIMWLFLSIVVNVIFLALLRIATAYYFMPDEPLISRHDFWQMLLTGLRFDVAIFIRAFVPVYLLSLLAIPLSRSVGKAVLSLGHWWGTILTAVTLSLSVINVVYIAFFNEPLNAFALESILYYDLNAILASIIGSGSLWIYVAAIILAILTVWLMIRLIQRYQRVHFFSYLGVWQSLSLVIVSFCLIMSLGRGSFGAFPLSHRHLIVSASPTLNKIVPNGLLTSYYVILEYIDSKDLAIAHNEEGRILFENFYGYPANKADLWSQIFSQTPKSALLEQQPPNVVLNIMESFGAELLRPEFNQTHDWAADLRPHLNSDLVMSRFLPAHNGTQSSLINLLGNINYPTVTQSKYKNIALLTAAAKVFKQAGYRTLFVYTGFEGERNHAEYFKRQGFDDFIGAARLQEMFTEMETNIWGGEDRYLFEYMTKKLLNKPKDSAPLFIVSLSINNHPPYVLLDEMTNAHLQLNPLVKQKLGKLPEVSMSTYEYSNRYLGRFISQIKASKRLKDTIVAVTGDHGTRGLRSSKGSELRDISVPLYLYIPPTYTPDEDLDLLQLASHKDIFPTLYHLSLSEASYPNLGRNLFKPVGTDDAHNFAINEQYSATQDGVLMNGNVDYIYPFTSDDDLQLGNAIPYNRVALVERREAYTSLKNWIMRKQLTKQLAQ